MFGLLIFILIIFLLEFYSFQVVKTIFNNKIVTIVYSIVNFSALIFVFYNIFNYDRTKGQSPFSLIVIGLLLLIIIPKMIVGVILFTEDIFRFFGGCIRYFTDDEKIKFFNKRRAFVSKIALGIAAIPFFSLIYGMTKGKYNFKVIKQKLFFEDLPAAFDGFTITQISDIHSGSFDNPEKIEEAISLINDQKSDLFLFTGDIVNNFAHEMDQWIDTFKKIETHPFGKYSVLGNHDYGEYIHWDSKENKKKNFEAIKAIHSNINFNLLMNQHVKIKKGTDEIAIVGVENWGRGFKKAGDLVKASEGLKKEDFKILMSHDPSHWEKEVKNNDKFYHLTLSGHTHGLQFGIEIPGWFKWSPVQYVYEQWAGLYEHLGRYIYVNRGFGFHAYPGRVGIMPEITVLELKKGSNKNIS